MIFRYPASSSSFACILIFSVAIAISTSSGQDDEDSRYLDCNQQIECGNWSFGFPFWGTSRPNFCGLPEFNLICDDNRFPTISISGLTYRILDINNSSQILTLLQTDYARDLCPTHPQNVTEVDNLFDFTDDTQFLNLYYDCTPPAAFGLQLPDSLESVVCLSNPSRWGYFVRTESIVGGYRSTIRSWLGQCSNRVRVPVNGTAVGSLEKDPMPARLTETIDQGFGMRWTANDSLCASCRTSGGQCGFSDTTRSFACFRVDQPYGEEGVPPATTPTAQPVDTDVSKRRILYSIISGVLSFLIISLAIFLILQRMKRKAKKDAKEKDMAFRLYDSEKGTKEFGEDDQKVIDVPFFDLKCIQSATDFFCISNKLGQGGFGPVYKGKFPGGQEIAVKRLSSGSTQGLEEFKNEVVLIAKLQHRNLVRLLGFCVEGSEKMLLYEYMPNKSLDFFIFDQSRSVLLNWEVRFNIIMGIARGMLYLHRDSRLTIVHRDLKTSNVLLDEEMSPKISDFGLARIIAAKQTEVDTVRVVGT
ncbi:G-type lectin S-receptor-like serine/threonine-protein kinase At4g03230 [Linum grandiflorum]